MNTETATAGPPQAVACQRWGDPSSARCQVLTAGNSLTGAVCSRLSRRAGVSRGGLDIPPQTPLALVRWRGGF